MGNRVVVAGAGGHARVCLDALLDDAGLEVIGCVSADGAGVDGLPVPVLGRTDDLAAIAAEYGCTRVFVAIGDNAARRRVAAEAHAARLSLVEAVSCHSMISRSAYVGAGAMVAAGAVVNAGAQVGMGVIVNTSASVDHDCRIEDFAHVAPGAVLGGEVVVGANALVAIGARVLPRVTIGENAVVGAGSVVVRDVAPGAVVVGVPAVAHFGLTAVRPAG